MSGWPSAPLTSLRMAAPATSPTFTTGAIEITPIPTVEELNAHVWGEEFHACVIEKAEFEAIWESRFYSGSFLKSEEWKMVEINRAGSMWIQTPTKSHYSAARVYPSMWMSTFGA